VDDCVAKAKQAAQGAITNVHVLVRLHEGNKLILSDEFAKQIPDSYAAHAFNDFRASMHSFEIVRLCALWDRADSDKINIPTAVRYLESRA
jgi:hypothetical protein